MPTRGTRAWPGRIRSDVRQVSAALLGALTAAVLLSGPPLCAAADKSGVSPNAISLPSGPGSIEGLGESFQPELNTGTAKYAVGISVPPGTAGHGPKLALSYEGGGGNGPLGFGWRIGFPIVQRRTDKGIPRYVDGPNEIDDDGDGVTDEADETDVFINERKEELVEGADGYWLSETEEAFVRYRRVGEHWEGNLPDGIRLEFGLTGAGRVVDPASGKVFRWFVERITDPHGNTIVFTYRTFPGPENINQIYLAEIRYGPHAPPWANFHFVAFGYDPRPDWFEDCRGGFPARTGMRLREIVVGTQGPDLPGHAAGDFNVDGTADRLNRKYLLAYVTHPHWSLLSSVTLVGADGTSTLPPIAFGYTVSSPPESASAAGAVIGSVNAPIQVMDNPLVDLADLNGDGLPDILKTEGGGGGPHTVFLNEGETADGAGKSVRWSAGIEVGGDQRAWNVDLASGTGAIAHLADMDGDGLADLAYKAGGEVYFFANPGDATWGTRRLMNVDPSDSSPPSPFGVPNVKTGDVDFDKRMDVIQSLDAGGGVEYRIWFNRGEGTYARSVTVSPEHGFMLGDPGVDIADVNGDRVPDVARISPAGLRVTTGLGHGRFTPLVDVQLPDLTLDSGQVARARLQDINGDGLADLVIERGAPAQLWYWLNLGNYTLDRQRIITGMPTPLGTSPAIRWADINGNGTTDLVYADGANEPRLQAVDIGRIIGCAPAPNLLLSIDNGLGLRTTIGYATTTDFLLADRAAQRPWPHTLPFPVHVVSRVTLDESLSGRSETAISYHDGYYDGAEKEFRGFAAVEQREIGDEVAPDLVSAYRFDTGVSIVALKGKTLRLEKRDGDGGVFYRDDYEWGTRKLFDGVSGDGRGVTFPFMRARTREVVERGSGPPVSILWEYEYDDYGNTTRSVEHGRLDAGWDDERVTLTSYSAEHASGRSLWILRKVIEQETTDENGTRYAQHRNYYDGSVTAGEVVRGNLTRAIDWVELESQIVTQRQEYDLYGNMRASYGPLYGTAPGHRREILFDETFKTFPVRETLSTGNVNVPELSFAAEYDVGLGATVAVIDLNGQRSSYDYDPFSRLISARIPPDAAATVEYDYVLGHDLGLGRIVSWTETRRRDQSPGDGFLRERSYQDGLGRLIVKRSESETPEEVLVSEASDFGARRIVSRRFFSYRESGTLDFAPPNALMPALSYRYDAYGRKIREDQPEMAGRRAFSTWTHEPLAILAKDREQTQSESPHAGAYSRSIEDGLLDENGRGRLREVVDAAKIDAAGAPTTVPAAWRTRYHVDILGRTTSMVDPLNNTRTYSYDGAGRLVSMNDPDRGTVRFFYDEASNITETIDAMGRRSMFRYDGLNRLLSEDYLDGEFLYSANRSPDIEYGYDVAAGRIDCGDGRNDLPGNTRGRPAWVRDLSGEEHTSYDERGRVAWVAKVIRDPVAGIPITFCTRKAYDSLDRHTGMEYPDGDRVGFRYNTRGFLESVSAGDGPQLFGGIAYTPEGQVSRIEFRNEVVSTRRHDVRNRLVAAETFRSALPEEPLLAFRYSHDEADNIVRIDDVRPTAVLPAGNPGRNTQIFGYDDLYRLTSARYSFAAPNDPDRSDGQITYRYDPIGNMRAQLSDIVHEEEGHSLTNLGVMSFGGSAGGSGRSGRAPGDQPGPRALTMTDNGVTRRVISYDDNGNVTGFDGKALSWDFKDRVVAVENAGFNARYFYDYQGRRVAKSVASSGGTGGPATTSLLVVNEHFEMRDGQPLKYVLVGRERLARISGAIDPAVPKVQRLVLHAGWNLVSVGVSAGTGLAERESITGIFRWDQVNRAWQAAENSIRLEQGQVLWLRASESLLLTLVGSQSAAVLPGPLSDGAFIGNPTLGEVSLGSDPPGGASLWIQDLASGVWRARFGGALSTVSDAPDSLRAGAVVYLNAPSEAPPAGFGDQSAQILFYHPDHLGSTVAVSDGDGRIHAEHAYYPFGLKRFSRVLSKPRSDHLFVGNEEDRETGLYQFHARFYSPLIGRFLSTEPLLKSPEALSGGSQSGLAYAYARNNPVNFFDVDGMREQKTYYEQMRENRLAEVKTYLELVTQLQAAPGNRLKEKIEGGGKVVYKLLDNMDVMVMTEEKLEGEGDHGRIVVNHFNPVREFSAQMELNMENVKPENYVKAILGIMTEEVQQELRQLPAETRLSGAGGGRGKPGRPGGGRKSTGPVVRRDLAEKTPTSPPGSENFGACFSGGAPTSQGGMDTDYPADGGNVEFWGSGWGE